MRKKKSILNPVKVAGGMIFLGSHLIYRPKYIYENKLKQNRIIEKPCVIIANHTSSKDGPFLMSVLGGTEIAAVVAKDWYEKKGLHWLFANNECIPIDRRGLDTDWVRKAVSKLKQGKSVLIFPEGRTGTDGKIDKFKSGFILLAVLAKVPILPVCLDGEYHAIGKRKKVMVGVPVSLDLPENPFNAEYMEAQSERFRQMIIKMQTKLESFNSWF